MDYLHRFYFFDPARTGTKRELFISSDTVDFITWHRQEKVTADATRIQTNIPFQAGPKTEFISHVVDGNPENCNQIIFDGLLFKCTVQCLSESDGSTKRYTSWVNPDNIISMYSFQPDSTEFFFRSGSRIILSNKQPDIMKALLEHNKKYKDRRKERYGKTPQKAA